MQATMINSLFAREMLILSGDLCENFYAQKGNSQSYFNKVQQQQ